MKTQKSIKLVALGIVALTFLLYLGARIQNLRNGPSQNGPSEVGGNPRLSPDSNKIENLQADGTRIVWIKEADKNSPNRIDLSKYTYSADGSLASLAVYRLDSNGNPLKCDIYDDQKNRLYYGDYGYRKSDGKLVQERFFNGHASRVNSASGSGEAVRMFFFDYDAKGNRLKQAVDEKADLLASQDSPKGFPKECFENPFGSADKSIFRTRRPTE